MRNITRNQLKRMAYLYHPKMVSYLQHHFKIRVLNIFHNLAFFETSLSFHNKSINSDFQLFIFSLEMIADCQTRNQYNYQNVKEQTYKQLQPRIRNLFSLIYFTFLLYELFCKIRLACRTLNQSQMCQEVDRPTINTLGSLIHIEKENALSRTRQQKDSMASICILSWP